MNISIIIVTWRSLDLLKACLRSLAAYASECQVIVVDNGSDDGTAEHVARHYPQVTLLALEHNVGFAAGCNRGSRLATGDRLLFLNPDAQATRGAVSTLAQALQDHPDAGAVGGLLIGDHGRPQARYGPQDIPRTRNLVLSLLLGQRRRQPVRASGRPYPVGQVAGACLMVHRSVYATLNGFDERFQPVFFEDVDFCRRLVQSGYSILHVPSACFSHKGGGCVRRMPAADHYSAWFDNLIRYGQKHHGPLAAMVLRALTVPAAGLRLAATLTPGGGSPFGRGARATACLQVASRSLTGWPKVSQSTS